MNNKLKIILGILILIVVSFFVIKNSTSTPVLTIEYKNTTYGFKVTLPKTWQGYTVTTDKWTGYKIDDQLGNIPYATGPVVSIHNPKWTKDNPYQDIPIMVFTIDDWNLLITEKMSVGAAPIPPSELARNQKYVFALPARYNYAFPPGYQEVDQIIQSKPVSAF